MMALVHLTLSTQNEELLDGQDPVNFTVTYYDNQIDAEARNQSTSKLL